MSLTNIDQFEVRLAKSRHEIFAAQMLRYQVFVEEFGATVNQNDQFKKTESDEFDKYCDHLIIIDKSSPILSNASQIVGTMRLLDAKIAQQNQGFYSANEYNLSKLVAQNKRALEISRACIKKKYRGSLGIHYLWLALAKYVRERDITLIFGVASFHGNNVSKFGSALTLLKQKFSAPKALEFRAKKTGYVDMNIVPLSQLDQKKAMDQMPSLLKTYLRMGALVSDGAFTDVRFNTIDVGLMMITELMNKKYKEFYGRPKETK